MNKEQPKQPTADFAPCPECGLLGKLVCFSPDMGHYNCDNGGQLPVGKQHCFSVRK